MNGTTKPTDQMIKDAVNAAPQNQNMNLRYSDEDLNFFKNLIKEKLKKEKEELGLLRGHCQNKNSTGDTSPGHQSFNECHETFSKEENAILVTRAEKHIRDLNSALIHIGNKSYGICRITGKLIPKERLKLTLHATLSMEGKTIEEDRKNGYHRHRH